MVLFQRMSQARSPKTQWDFLKHDDVVSGYYDECSAIVREATGASCVYAFDHKIRSCAVIYDLEAL